MSLARSTWLRRAGRGQRRSWRLRIWCVVLAGIAVATCTVPLLGTFGFGFSFVMALAASIAGLDLGADLVVRAREAPAHALDHARPAGRIVLGLWWRATVHVLAALVLPLIIVLLNAFRVRNCDYGFGALAFLAMPTLSSVYGSGVGVALGLLCGPKRRLSRALPFVFFVAAVLASLLSFYGSPPVFFYNPLAGYFPGNLYDEQIELGSTFAWARTYHFAVIGVGLSALAATIDVPSLALRRRLRRRPQSPRRGPRLAVVVLLVVVASLWWKSADLGFAVSADDIQEGLGGHHRTEHFDIYYPADDDEIAADIERIAEDHEFRYAQVVRELGVEAAGRIGSYVFVDDEQKHRWMGARRVHMAKPWRREIYVNYRPFPHEIIRHEIAHAVAAEFGSPIFKVSAGSVAGLPLAFNPGMIEGLAVAAAWPNSFEQTLTPHQSVKAMIELGLAPPLDRVLSTSFFSYSGARSYTTAGSFVRLLLDRYGDAKVRALYQTGGDFRAVFGVPQETLVAEWNQMIAAIELPADEAERVKERFRPGSVFERPCPHFVARAQSAVAEAFRRGDRDGAIRRWQDVCDRVPDEPRYWLDLADLYRRSDQPGKVRPVLERFADDPKVSAPIRAEALTELALGDLAGGDEERAKQRMRRAQSLPLGEVESRNLAAMLHVLDHQGPAGPHLRDYFFAARDLDARQRQVVLVGYVAQALAAEPDNALAHYLLGRNLHGRGDPAAASAELARALELGLHEPLVTRECARLLADSAYLSGDDSLAARAARKLAAPDQPLVTRLEGLDWLERLHWRKTGAVPRPAMQTAAWEPSPLPATQPAASEPGYMPDTNFQSSPSRASTN